MKKQKLIFDLGGKWVILKGGISVRICWCDYGERKKNRCKYLTIPPPLLNSLEVERALQFDVFPLKNAHSRS